MMLSIGYQTLLACQRTLGHSLELHRSTYRCLHRAFHISSGARHQVLPLAYQNRPCLPWSSKNLALQQGRSSALRQIFIRTQETPNTDALKFVLGYQILPDAFPSTFLEYLTPRSTLSPPYPSPLATQLFNIDGIMSVFYAADSITITKAAEANWAHIKPEIFSLVTEAITSGAQIVKTDVDGPKEKGENCLEKDSLTYSEDDSEVVSMIKELLETRIRPAIQEDGGDIEFRGFENGEVLLKLRGACRTCDSSTVTLRNGIESMLIHYIEEVKGVRQVLDQEEEVAIAEFARFEEKLKQQRGKDTAHSATGDSSSTLAEL